MGKFILFLILLGASVGVFFVSWEKISKYVPRNTASVVSIDISIEIPEGLSRIELSKSIGNVLNWDETTISTFASIYSQMQWAEFNSLFIPILSKKLKWNSEQQEIFVTNSAKYFTHPNLDFFGRIYIPGKYTIKQEASLAQIAGLFIEEVKAAKVSNLEDFITEKISTSDIDQIKKFIRSEYELLPDLVPLPPQDVRIDKIDKKILISFTTVYYNQGRGPLELLADPKTKGIRKDLERKVFQRIYLPDGTHRDKVAGSFLWHQSHLHYHFADFILYDLEPVDVEGIAPDLSGVLAKSTFCIRDISKVVLDLSHSKKDAVYEICGKEKQGISVGWGDAYFYTYPDQNLNITDLPSGLYRLTFKANPDRLFDEVTYDNNTSSALIYIDMKNVKISIIEEVPDKIPEFKHVYPIQENCASCTL